MKFALVRVASHPGLVVAGIGTLAVAVAAVVVVLAIIAVIVMVLRSSGGGRQTSGGIGYDARQRSMGPSQNEYDAAPPPWSRQANRSVPGGMGQDAAGNYGAGARNSGANWGAQPEQPAMGGAWGAPSGANYGQVAAGAAAGNGGYGNPAMGGPSLAQNQPAWGDAPAGAAGGRPWDAQANQGWAPGGSAMPSNGNWGGTDQLGMPGGQWNGMPAPVEQPAGQNWNMPPAAAPVQNAWGVPSAGAAPAQNAWGVPSVAGAPAAEGWGVPAAPTSPGWNAPPAPASTGTWGAGPQGTGYDVAPNNAPYGTDADPRQRAANGLRAGAVVVKQGKEPGRIFEIRGDRLTIGRSRDSDIFLEDLAVSRLHATVYRESNGQYLVRDENSANGTTVNGQRITDHVLEEGDEIGLGQTILSFVRR